MNKILTGLLVTFTCSASFADDGVGDFLKNFASQGPVLCGYGYLRAADGTCAQINSDYQSPECPLIDGAHTHLINLDTNSFRYLEFSEHKCLGMYSIYQYNPNIFVDVPSTGDYFAFGPSMCGYGEYNLNGTCVKTVSSDAQQKCSSGSHLTVATNASFMGPRDEAPRCNGDYTLYNFVTDTSDRIYPLYVGTFLFIGTELKVNTFDDMYKNRCMSGISGYEDISAEYYNIDLIGVAADYQPFQHPERGMCESGFRKFVAHTDCKDIDTKSANAPSECWVLCTGAGEVYTNSGRCSTEGYCENGDKKMRLHVALPGANGKKYSYPLYASKTSDPAMHFKFINASGAEQMCYVNLVPPEAIEHFVGTKPNPIRTMFYNPDVGKNETLITID